MNLTDIALLNLRRKKAKAAFVLAGLLTGVATMVALMGLGSALTHEVNHKLEKYGANILITPKSDQLNLTYGGLSLGGFSFATREIKQADLGRIKHIANSANLAAVGPMVLGRVEAGSRPVLLAGVDWREARILKPWWKLRGAEPLAGQVAPGAEAARLLGLKPGDRVSIQGRELTVSGVLEPTGSQDDHLLFMPLAPAQELLGKQGLVSMVEVAALCKDCPIEAMVAQIGKALPGAKVMAIRSVVQGRMETIASFKRFALGVSLLVALLGGLVVLVTMMGSVKERTNEIGIFRAIGFRSGQVMRVVLTEALILSAAAGLLGYLAGHGAGELALPWFSEGSGVHLAWDPLLAAIALGLALVCGALASLYPAYMASRLDPAQALRTL
ncbi:MAG: ABC transporter permease [Desulfarculaceae bacterium]|nr:ABC transporter permease [Desulfarculaceae bacterium]MCF8072492.1 ABC transporter permease [Desulfarculaceae bacterium]MCF8102953.1 ABC transporter permease [Desulfarculaceae bacterium]MCF8117033.1 ABC transporter permease [Desulfarculaceae bacterium]